jgi:hypothetical protein
MLLALGRNCPRDFNQPIKSSKVLTCNFLMGYPSKALKHYIDYEFFRMPESLEMSLIYMCDVISFSQFFQFDSVSTQSFKLKEKNYQSDFFSYFAIVTIKFSYHMQLF